MLETRVYPAVTEHVYGTDRVWEKDRPRSRGGGRTGRIVGNRVVGSPANRTRPPKSVGRGDRVSTGDRSHASIEFFRRYFGCAVMSSASAAGDTARQTLYVCRFRATSSRREAIRNATGLFDENVMSTTIYVSFLSFPTFFHSYDVGASRFLPTRFSPLFYNVV